MICSFMDICTDILVFKKWHNLDGDPWMAQMIMIKKLFLWFERN